MPPRSGDLEAALAPGLGHQLEREVETGGTEPGLLRIDVLDEEREQSTAHGPGAHRGRPRLVVGDHEVHAEGRVLGMLRVHVPPEVHADDEPEVLGEPVRVRARVRRGQRHSDLRELHRAPPGPVGRSFGDRSATFPEPRSEVKPLVTTLPAR